MTRWTYYRTAPFMAEPGGILVRANDQHVERFTPAEGWRPSLPLERSLTAHPDYWRPLRIEAAQLPAEARRAGRTQR